MTSPGQSSSDALNSWQQLNRSAQEPAATPTPKPSPEPEEPLQSSDRKWVGFAVAAAVVLFGGGAALVALSGGDSGGGEPSADEAAVDDEDAASVNESDPDTLAAVDDEREETSAEEEPAVKLEPVDQPDDGEEAVQTSDEVASPAVPVGASGNYSVVSGGKIFLRGALPSALVESLIVAAVTEIMGEGNVISEYEIDPAAPFQEGEDSPVYIEDTILFQHNSAEIAPEFQPLLGLGLTLLQVQETVSIEILGHTDSVGPDEYNLELSQQRVDAVKGFFVAQGIVADRVIATGRGETEPRASNDTPEGRQANRRVEIVIKGFKFSR